MGYFGKLEKKELAIKLRKKGLSYKEILQTVSVSKDTLSRWCKDIPLIEEQKYRLLKNKLYGQKKGSLIAAENKRQQRKKRISEIYKEAEVSLGNLNIRDKFITGIALYAAEGNKMDGKGGFANADPKIIKFMIEWLTTYTKIPLERIRGAIWLHEELNEKKAKEFWSHYTGLSLSQFHKTYIVKRKKNTKIRKNLHEYGIFTIRFSDSAVHRQIMGWIYALFNAKITNIIFRDSSTVEQEAVKIAAPDRNIRMKNRANSGKS